MELLCLQRQSGFISAKTRRFYCCKDKEVLLLQRQGSFIAAKTRRFYCCKDEDVLSVTVKDYGLKSIFNISLKYHRRIFCSIT